VTAGSVMVDCTQGSRQN